MFLVGEGATLMAMVYTCTYVWVTIAIQGLPSLPYGVPAVYLWYHLFMGYHHNLLPTGSEEREVLGMGSIPVAILLSCLDMEHIALQLHKHENSRVMKIRSTSEAVLRPQYSLWPSY